MKSLKEIREDIATDAPLQGQGEIRGLATPVAIRDLKEYGRQVSNALQPSIPQLLANMEKELNKYGFSLGEIDSSDSFEASGEEDFIVFSFPNGEELKNLFLSLKWEKVSTPTTYEFRQEKLENSVKLSVSEIAPEDFEDMLANGDVSIQGDDSIDGDELYGDDDDDYVKEENISESEIPKLTTIRGNLIQEGANLNRIAKSTTPEIKQAAKKSAKYIEQAEEAIFQVIEKNRGLKEETSFRVQFDGKTTGETHGVTIKAKDGNEALKKFKKSHADLLSTIKDIVVLKEGKSEDKAKNYKTQISKYSDNKAVLKQINKKVLSDNDLDDTPKDELDAQINRLLREEKLSESVIYRIKQKAFFAAPGTGNDLEVHQKPEGLVFLIDGQTVTIKKQDKNAFITKLTDFLIGEEI